MSAPMLLPELVARQVALTPDRPAVAAAGSQLTYAELDARADALAHRLVTRGAAPDQPVGVLLPRGVDLVVALLAVWRAGACYLPLDPGHPQARLAGLVERTGLGLVVTDTARHDLVTAAGAKPVHTDDLAPAGTFERVAVAPHGAAYVMHTSGSTGHPKGVVVDHAGLANRVRWAVGELALTAADRVLQKTPVTFDAAGWEIFAPLIVGGTVVLAPDGAEREPAALLKAVADEGVSVLQVVPSVLHELLEVDGWERCGALRALCCAGEPLHAEQVRRALALAPGELAVWNTYGPTECSIDITAHRFDPAQQTGPVPIGRPITGMRVLVLDADGRPADEGELFAGGPGVARGYLGRADLTAERFVPDPSGPAGARLYRTGDRVRVRADGSLEYLGRIDRQVKVNGVRMEPGEIEYALESHPAIAGAAVVAVATPAGGTALAAYVRAAAVPDGLREYLGERLPATHVPSVLIAVERFPTTPNGKLDHAALPAPPFAAAPARQASAAEETVAEVWRKLFKTDDIAADADFYQLGGTSLQFTRLVNRLRKATGRDLALADLLNATTIADQARLLDGSDEQQDGPAEQAGDGLVPLPRTGPLPLSFGQRRLWVVDRMQPRSREWVSALFLPVPDGADAAEIGAALDGLVERHEALRTAFVVRDGEPMQLIRPTGSLELTAVDVAGHKLPGVLDRELDRGFDLDGGPLARALLARDPAPGGRQVLMLSVHHIICDGWSSSVLEREFTEILDALRTGRAPRLAALPVQYADFASWQRERITPETVERELTHWRRTLSGAAPLELRADRPRPRVRDAKGAMVPVELSPEVTEALTEIGRRHGASPFMTLLTGFATLLARQTGQWDVVLGTPVAGRDRPGTEGVVGFFLNSLVLRLGLERGLSFTAAVERVRDVCREAFAHQELPFEQLVADLAPERDSARTPLYQVAFDLHDEELTGSAADGADFATLIEVSRIAKTDLTLYLRRRADGGMSGGLEYATSLFDRDTVERMADQLVLLLQEASSAPAARLDEVDVLPPAERDELLRWSATAAPAYTLDAPGRFERQADATPGAVALRTGQGEVTYGELDVRANRIAHRLQQLGAGTDTVVGVLVDRGADLMAALLGVWKAGAAYLPIEPGTPAERIRYMLTDAGATLLVSDSGGLDGITTVPPHVPDAGDDRPARSADPERLAYVIYTSGSTGRPKGVEITQAGLTGHLSWAVAELALAAPGGAAVFTSVAFDLGVPNLWAGLLAGRPTTLLPQDLDLTELGDRLVAAAPLAFLKLTPGHLEILSGLADERIAGLAARIVVAGEALPVALADRWAALLGPGRLINEYGPTEASVGTCVHPLTAPVGRETVPIGRPLPGVRMHVLDAWLRPVPIGAVGELCVGGAGIGRGYTGRPELTAEKFVPDPYGIPGERLYRTGDLARVLDGGAVEFLGRSDTQVKIRGYRIELAEIAAVVTEHPQVRQAVATVDQGQIGVCYVPEGQAPDARSLHTLCAERLPEYMLPVSFTALDAIPLNANGKVDRAALPGPASQPQELVAPDGIVEERVAEIFAELLAVPVGADTGFFRAGGNSILAIRLVAALQDAFDIDLPIRAVFEGPTVAELAALIEELVRAELDELSDAELDAYGKEDGSGLRLDERAEAAS
ncbi:non-ribosomal peptide synthetase [Streptomyces sp. VRA16 Mangrove soil]|uniref:non-ribosomal peptide synthetase n=1 Tax=Streptomyces sp. VRA16 Mangrove soil TaxID=2817434 RepID=UPI001A9F6A20|nr:non-ribosomal peptide synthetase [Streptomyces sp. VRA16 Mangrove soil]MBO1334091.1 amino acid adenylation domain-containing protein [Streptomyces sp. VRA16 Mangrove soil]